MSCVYSAETRSSWPPFWRRSQGTHSWDKMADNTAHGLISVGDRKTCPAQLWGDHRLLFSIKARDFIISLVTISCGLFAVALLRDTVKYIYFSWWGELLFFEATSCLGKVVAIFNLIYRPTIVSSCSLIMNLCNSLKIAACYTEWFNASMWNVDYPTDLTVVRPCSSLPHQNFLLYPDCRNGEHGSVLHVLKRQIIFNST
jgi:hypothetical protein